MPEITHEDLSRMRDDLMNHVNRCMAELTSELRATTLALTRATTQIDERDRLRKGSCPHIETIVRAGNNIKRIGDMEKDIESLREDFHGLNLLLAKISAPVGLLTGAIGNLVVSWIGKMFQP